MLRLGEDARFYCTIKRCQWSFCSFHTQFRPSLPSKNSVFPNHPPSFSMNPKKIVSVKRKRMGSSSRAPIPLPNNPKKFITRDAERLYHDSFFNRTFILNTNVYLNFVIKEKGWTKLCEHPLPGIAQVVREFHSNFQSRIGSTVYVYGNCDK